MEEVAQVGLGVERGDRRRANGLDGRAGDLPLLVLHLDDAGVRFYVMDCVLEYPKPESGEWKQGRVEVMDFLCSDIYEEGLAERVQASNDAAEDYYDEMDAIKKEEELGK